MDPTILNWLFGFGSSILVGFGTYCYIDGGIPHPIKNARKRIEEEREALYIPYKSRLEELTDDYISRARPTGLPDGYERDVAFRIEWQKEWEWIENLPSARATKQHIHQTALQHSLELERKTAERESSLIANQLAKLSGKERDAFIEAMVNTDYYRYYYRYMSRKMRQL